MSVVRLSDVVVPTVYETYGKINIFENDALFETGIVANSDFLNQVARQGSITGTMPFWGDIDPTVEPNMSNDDPADIAVPMKIGTSTMNYRKSFLNQGWSSMDLVAEVNGADPMTRIKERTDTYWLRQYKRRLFASVKGLIADNLANDSGDMGLNISGLTGAASIIGAASTIQAAYTMGDASGNLKVAIMHSQVMQRLVLQQLIVYVPDSQGNLVLPTYLGYRCIMDDSMIWSGSGSSANFLTLFVGPGAFGYGGVSGHLFNIGEGIPKTPSAIVRNEDTGNGGGQETLWERKTILLQPAGFNWVEGTLTEYSPTLSDLQSATHWDRKIPRKSVPMAYLISKAN